MRFAEEAKVLETILCNLADGRKSGTVELDLDDLPVADLPQGFDVGIAPDVFTAELSVDDEAGADTAGIGLQYEALAIDEEDERIAGHDVDEGLLHQDDPELEELVLAFVLDPPRLDEHVLGVEKHDVGTFHVAFARVAHDAALAGEFVLGDDTSGRILGHEGHGAAGEDGEGDEQTLEHDCSLSKWAVP